MQLWRRAGWWRALTLFVWACALVPAPRAHADAKAGREARDWFERGISASRAGNFAEAAQAFERSRALSERPSVLQNLAVALSQLGRFNEALLAVERAIELGGGDTSSRAATRLESLRAELLGQVAEVTFEGTPGDARLEFDGKALTRAWVRCDPGAHSLRITHPDYESEERTLTLEAGARRKEQFSLRARQLAQALPPVQLAPSSPSPARGATREHKFKPWAIATLSLGVAMAGAGGALWFLADHEQATWKKRCREQLCEPDDPRLTRNQKHIDRLDWGATALFGLAGAAALSATTLFWLHGREQRRLSMALGPRHLQLRLWF